MRRLPAIVIVVAVGVSSALAGGLVSHKFRIIKTALISSFLPAGTSAEPRWGSGFAQVTIESRRDSTPQSAYFLSARAGPPKPLVVSLHTWSGNYAEYNALAEPVKTAGWNYIQPDFRGANNAQDACLSEKVLSDIDDAIQYAIDKGNVDLGNLFVVGLSGGGYATLGLWSRTTHAVNTFFSWVPISDLAAWYHETKHRGLIFAQDILSCTSDGVNFDEAKAHERSPLFWNLPEHPNGKLEIYAGIDDGYKGTVPITHSIYFFNRVAKHYGFEEALVGGDEVVTLLTRGADMSRASGIINDRRIVLSRHTNPVLLIIFEGGHEILTDFTFERISQIVVQDADASSDSHRTDVL